MRPFLVVVSAPSLQLFARIRKADEPVRIHAFRPNPAVERFGKRVVRRLARPREVERNALRISPQIKVATDKLRALVDADRLRIAHLRAGPFERLHDVFAAVARSRVQRRRVAGERVDNRQDADLMAGR